MLGTVYDTEFDKLNLQLLKETKEDRNALISNKSTSNEIVFSNGNTYKYDINEQSIYLNDNIKIAEHIESCKFEIRNINNVQRLIATIKISGKQRITEYVLTETIITAGTKAAETSTYLDANGKAAIIPEGFTVSGAATEKTIDGGLVIYLIDDKTDEEIANINWTDGTIVANMQTTYDQFVWIPVESQNDMFICQGKTTENGECNIKVINGKAECQTGSHKTLEEDSAIYKNTLMAGRLYATGTEENFDSSLTTQKYTANSGLREPDVVTTYDGDSTYLTQMSSILGTEGYDTTENFKTTLQNDYNTIVKSVYKNKGFWVGRYETSGIINSNTNTTVKVVAGTTTGINNVTWYRMYAQQKKYAENKGLNTVTSSMIQGAAYDQVMKFVNTASYSVTIAGNVAHGSSQGITGVYQTGGLNYPSGATIAYNDVSKNIYDLEGNLYVWTTEAYNTNARVLRGSNYNYNNSASFRNSNSPNNPLTDSRFVGRTLRRSVI